MIIISAQLLFFFALFVLAVMLLNMPSPERYAGLFLFGVPAFLIWALFL